MKWYKPKWLKWMQVGISIALAAMYLMFGWILIEINYVVIEGDSNENF